MINDKLKLYKKLCLIRKTEEAIQKYYYDNEMKTPMHMSIGEEAVVAGVCSALRKEDQVFGTHRSHALYIAKTEETDLFFNELYGKKDGLANGKCGSMHLSNPEYGFMGGSAIVGGNFAMASGASFANQYLNNDKIVVVFFGDGAIDEGSFWESFNISCLYKLPIIFVCEDNDLAVYTNQEKRHGYKDICNIVSQFNCKNICDTTTDIDIIYNYTIEAIKEIKEKKHPVFMHLRYYRYLDHVGVNEDFHLSYRNKEEFYKWKEVDPINLYREKLLKNTNENFLIEIEEKIKFQIEKSIKKAKQSEFCDMSELQKGMFYGR